VYFPDTSYFPLYKMDHNHGRPSFLISCSQFPLNKLTDQLRESLAQGGFTEGLTFSLVYFPTHLQLNPVVKSA